MLSLSLARTIKPLPLRRHLEPSPAERDSVAANRLHVGMAFHKALGILPVVDLFECHSLERKQLCADARFFFVRGRVEVVVFALDAEFFEFGNRYRFQFDE